MKPCRSMLRAQVRRSAEFLGRDPDDAEAWHDLGVALLALDDRAGACAALRLFERATIRPAMA